MFDLNPLVFALSQMQCLFKPNEYLRTRVFKYNSFHCKQVRTRALLTRSSRMSLITPIFSTVFLSLSCSSRNNSSIPIPFRFPFPVRSTFIHSFLFTRICHTLRVKSELCGFVQYNKNSQFLKQYFSLSTALYHTVQFNEAASKQLFIKAHALRRAAMH